MLTIAGGIIIAVVALGIGGFLLQVLAMIFLEYMEDRRNRPYPTPLQALGRLALMLLIVAGIWIWLTKP